MAQTTTEQAQSASPISSFELSKVFDFQDKKFRVAGTIDKPWFCGRDVAEILGYKNITRDVNRHVKEHNRIKYEDLMAKIMGTPIPIKYNQANLIYINENGLIELLCKCRLPNKCIFIKWCNEMYNTNIQSKTFLLREQDTIGSIIRSFPSIKTERQFSIGKYRIDLYFIDTKIAVECDEQGHKHRNEKYETDRQKYIEEHLNCVFIRYNPDAPDFDIFEVIGRITSTIY